ncbi:hypothetical protein ACFX15_007573 [Malus domestica]
MCSTKSGRSSRNSWVLMLEDSPDVSPPMFQASINIHLALETSSTLSLSLWYFQLRRHRHRQLSQVVGVDIDSGDPTRGVDAGDTNPIDFINGTVVLMKKNVLDFNDLNASVLDSVYELVGQWVSLQLISAVHADDSTTT